MEFISISLRSFVVNPLNKWLCGGWEVWRVEVGMDLQSSLKSGNLNSTKREIPTKPLLEFRFPDILSPRVFVRCLAQVSHARLQAEQSDICDIALVCGNPLN